MNGLLIFNNSNDIIFKRLNAELAAKCAEIAKAQGLLEEASKLDNNILLQIFSPIVNSQKIMSCQFDNMYNSFQCENNLNFVFGEFLGYAFVQIGTRRISQLRRHLAVCVSFAKHICAANLFLLQEDAQKAELFEDLVAEYERLYENDLGVLLEAMPQLLINADLSNTMSHILQSALNKLKDLDFNRSHGILFVLNKYVGSLSSLHGHKLSPSDILFTYVLCRMLQAKSPKRSFSKTIPLFLEGDHSSSVSGCIPCVLNASKLEKNVVLVLLVEYGSLQVACNLYDTYFVLQKILKMQMQGDTDNLKATFENMELYVKQSLDALKKVKTKSAECEGAHKMFVAKWDGLRKMYLEYFKSGERDLGVRIESNIPGFQEQLKNLFRVASMDTKAIQNDIEKIPEVATIVEEKLLEFSEFMSVKAERNVSIESYLEEFPGLVHFIYINRSTGTMLASDIPKDSKLICKENIRSMVEFTRSYLKSGHTSVMWKDTIFNYSYFLWFEDQHLGTAKPVVLNNSFSNANTTSKQQQEPGILASDYYQQLVDTCYPKAGSNKIKCYELYCIHLGLVTATCAVEHCRRLVATIADVD